MNDWNQFARDANDAMVWRKGEEEPKEGNDKDGLFAYQRKLLKKNPQKMFVLWPCGRGKTRMACEWAKQNGGSTLVVTTKGLQTQWAREIEKWDVVAGVCSKEHFKKGKPKFDNLIIDECDYFLSANFKSQLSKSLRKYLKDYNPRLCMMSAVMYRSSPWNVFTAASLLGLKWSYNAFRNTYFVPVMMGMRTIWMIKKDKTTQKRLRETIERICETIDSADDFEIPTHTYETITIDEDDSQRKAKADNHEIHHMSRFTKDHRAEAMNKNKWEQIEILCRENDKTIVVCRFIDQMDQMEEYLRARGHEVLKIWGGNINRQEVVDKAEKAERVVVIVQSDTVAGYELPSFRVMIFASMSYSTYSHTQVVGRNDRINAIAKNTYIYLSAGECDRAIKASVDKNQNFDPLLFYKYNNA